MNKMKQNGHFSGRLLASISAAAMAVSMMSVLPASAEDPTFTIPDERLSILVDAAVENVITVSAGGVMTSAVSTTPEKVNIGIGCGGCAGGCTPTCSDVFGFCQCAGNMLVVPEVFIDTPPDDAIAAASISGGKLIVEGNANGTTTLTLKAKFQYDASNFNAIGITNPMTVTINVGDSPGKEKLPVPQNLTYDKDAYKLHWDSVAHAESYLVKATNTTVAGVFASKLVETNEIDLSVFHPELYGGLYNFTVTAIPEGSSSEYGKSDPAELLSIKLLPVKLDLPTGLTYIASTHSLLWNKPPVVDGYFDTYYVYATNVKTDEKTQISKFSNGSTSSTASFAMNSFNSTSVLAPGEYRFSVQATGEQDTTVGYLDENWNYYEVEVPAKYSASDETGLTPQTYRKTYGARSVTGDYTGKNITLEMNYTIDFEKFDAADSGIVFKINGVVNPLISYLKVSDTKIKLTYQNVVENPDDKLELTFTDGTLQSPNGDQYIGEYDVDSLALYRLQPGYITSLTGATDSSLSDMALDADGNLILSSSSGDNYSYFIRKFNLQTGEMTTLAGTGSYQSPKPSEIENGVTLAKNTAVNPISVAVGPDGLIYYLAWNSDGSYIARINADGTLTVIAGQDKAIGQEFAKGALATDLYLKNIQSFVFDSHGDIYYLEYFNIKKIDMETGTVTAVAGSGTSSQNQVVTAAENIAANKIDGDPLAANLYLRSMEIQNDVLYFYDDATSQYLKMDMTKDNPKIETVLGIPSKSTDATGTISTLTTVNASMEAEGLALDIDMPSSYAFGLDSAGNLYFAQRTGNTKSLFYRYDMEENKVYLMGGNGYVSYGTPLISAMQSGRVMSYLEYGDSMLMGLFGSNSGIYVFRTVENIGAEALASPQNVQITDNTISWDSVPHATGYLITYTDKDGTTFTDTVTMKTSFDSATRWDKLSAGEYSVTVTAKTVSIAYTDSEPSAAITYQAPQQTPDHVVISEVYGGAGVTDAPYHSDFVELYNPTDEPIDVTGWSVQTYNTTNNASTGAVNLSGVILPHSYYLIKGITVGSSGNEVTGADVAAENIDILPLYAKVALLSHPQGMQSMQDEFLVDLVAVGGTEYEGSTYVSTKSMTSSLARKSNNGIDPAKDTGTGTGWDTDQNRADFVVSAAPTPQGSAYREPLYIAAASGGVAIHGSYADGFTAQTDLVFENADYSAADIKATHYLWYDGTGTYLGMTKDDTSFTGVPAVGTKLYTKAVVVYQNGEINTPLSSGTMQLLPDQVSGLTAWEITQTSMNLEWNVQPEATGYEIYSTPAGGEKALLATIQDGLVSSAPLEKLTPDTEYTFEIRAFAAVGEETKYGVFSEPFTVTTLQKDDAQEPVKPTEPNDDSGVDTPDEKPSDEQPQDSNSGLENNSDSSPDTAVDNAENPKTGGTVGIAVALSLLAAAGISIAGKKREKRGMFL